MPAVSVLMPVFNGAQYLPQALRSLFWQTFADWELILIDDGSSDNSLEIAQSYTQGDTRVRLYSLSHRGIVAALNTGIELCHSPWIARMDSDDIACPRRLEKQLAWAQAHPDIDVWGSFVRLFPQRERTFGQRRYERWLNRYWQCQDLARDMFVESPLVHPSVLMRTQALRNAGGYQECPWPEDYDLWMRLWQQGHKMAKVPEVLLFWRDSAKRLTRVDARCSHARLRELKLFYLMSTFFPHCHPGEPSLPERPVLIWGAGTNGKDLVISLRSLGLCPSGFVDNNASRRGQKILGLPVLGLDQVTLSQGEFIVMAVSNPYIRAQIREQLHRLGAREGHDYVCLANVAKPTGRQKRVENC